ncbi:hypothetical protein BDR05DRAFT_896513 [Suillus weaverae]|nr:hypothetical protein BDR05DRAFT_896513 [Suillus weaverae]
MYDFTCQDLPPGIEDAHDSFFAPQTGIFQRFMSWDPVELRSDPDETQPSLPAQLKTKIFEIAESVWELIGSNKLPGVADDSVRFHIKSA